MRYRVLKIAALVTSVVLVIASVSVVLVYGLSASASFIVLIAVIPFLIGAGWFSVAALRLTATSVGAIRMLRAASGVGLPIIFLGGAWSGFGMLFLSPNETSFYAVYAYLVTYLLAIAGVLAVLILAFATPIKVK